MFKVKFTNGVTHSFRALALGLSALTLVYLVESVIGRQDKFKQFFDSILSKSFTDLLDWSSHVLIGLIALMALVVLIRAINFGLGLKRGITIISPGRTHDLSYRMLNVNNSLHLGWFRGHTFLEKQEYIFSQFGFIAKKVMIFSALALVTWSFVDVFTNKSSMTNALGFNLVPEFIKDSKALLIATATIFSAILLVCVYNLVVDILNVCGIGLEDKKPQNNEISESNKSNQSYSYQKHAEDHLLDGIAFGGSKFVSGVAAFPGKISEIYTKIKPKCIKKVEKNCTYESDMERDAPKSSEDKNGPSFSLTTMRNWLSEHNPFSCCSGGHRKQRGTFSKL
jgi:hypothetical protein